jgi:DNA polymerase I-like protein with 3'-5' exonuclease and polymerase domains
MPLIVTWHPTYAFFHNPYEWGAFSLDLNRFARLTRKELEPIPTRLITKPTVKDIQRVAQNKEVGLDIETGPSDPAKPWTGKDPEQAVLRTLGLGNEDWGLSIWWATASDEVKAAAFKLLMDPKVLKILQNGHWFDLRVLGRYDVKPAPIFDVRDARRACSATSPLNLRYMTSISTDADPWKEGDEDDEKGLVLRAPRSEDEKTQLMQYNVKDCVYTSRVKRMIVREPEWKTTRVQKLYKMHSELSRIASEMHSTGFVIDQYQRWHLAKVLEVEYEYREAELIKTVNVPGFKCSPNGMRALIYKRHETKDCRKFSLPDPLDPSMYSDEDMNTISVKQEALLLLLIDPGCPDELRHIIDLYWYAESVWKARSTYVVSNKVEHAIGPDGRLRAGWNSCGTDTGRWSCSEPNLQNLSEKKEEGSSLGGDLPSMRSMYRAGTGNILVHADYSQVELRVIAEITQDRALIEALATGDVYSYDARKWFGLADNFDVKKLKPQARKASKIIHLASNYAAGTPKVYQQALKQDRTMKYSAVSLLHNQFKQLYKGIVDYWASEQAKVGEVGYSESRIMRRRRVYPREPEITDVANYPIQSTASDIVNLAMIALDAQLKRYVPRARIITQLHDAFDVECPYREAKTVSKIVQECMEVEYDIEGRKCKFPVEIKTGERWSDV